MINKPYPGRCEEMNGTYPSYPEIQDDIEPESDEAPIENLSARTSRRVVNSYVTMSDRSFSAIRQETVLTLKNFLLQRMAIDQRQEVKNLQAVFECNNAVDMATKARHFTDKMKMGDAMELTDSCFELFAKDPSLCQGDITPLQRLTHSSYQEHFENLAIGSSCYSSIVGCASFHGCRENSVSLQHY